MERIVFLDRKSLSANIKKPSFPHEWRDFPMTQKDEVVERLRNATIAITNKVALRKDALKELPNLRLIAVAATGTDCVDVKYCRERGITVTNVRDYARFSVPEHVFALILALRRNLFAYDRAARGGAWRKSDVFFLLNYPIRDLRGSTLGIIGYGGLGQAVEKIASAFGMKVIIAEHKDEKKTRKRRMSFEETLRASDIISLHCPLTDKTRDLLGAREFKKMRRGALLINCGRGGLVDEKALVKALQNGEIAGAGVDVLSAEPPAEGNPLLDLQIPNLIVTPHVAWASFEAMQALADILTDNLEAFAAGKPRNVV